MKLPGGALINSVSLNHDHGNNKITDSDFPSIAMTCAARASSKDP
jgi:hypothetical protein